LAGIQRKQGEEKQQSHLADLHQLEGPNSRANVAPTPETPEVSANPIDAAPAAEILASPGKHDSDITSRVNGEGRIGKGVIRIPDL
jgi:hypothetical protein